MNAQKHPEPDDNDHRDTPGNSTPRDEVDAKTGYNDGSGETEKKGLSTRAKIILLILAVVVIVGGIVWYLRYEAHGKFLQTTDDATVQADAVTVAPRVSGYVDQVLVADNQEVKTGQVLAHIDPRDARAQAAQAQAQIGQAIASADATRASIHEQQATIAQAAAQLAAAEAKAAHDAGEVARYTPLAASGAETRQQLAQLQATATQSAQDVRAQAAALEMQRRRIGQYQAQIRQSQAQAAGARAQLASANVDVNGTTLKAAIDGKIGDKTVTIGQYVQAGTRLMSVVPVRRLYITANFKETQLGLMRPGQPVDIEVDALDGVRITGRVESIAPGTGAQFSLIPPNNATGNFTKIVQRVPVRVSIEATPAAYRLLVPGLSVNVTVDTIGAKGDLEQVRHEQHQYNNGKK